MPGDMPGDMLGDMLDGPVVEGGLVERRVP